MKILVFLVVVFGAFTIHAMIGFGSSILAIPFCSMVLGLTEAKIILNIISVVYSIPIVISCRRDIDYKELIRILIVMLAGIIIGRGLSDILEDELLLRGYSMFVLIFGLTNLLVKKKFTFGRVTNFVILLAAGIIQGMILVGGPLLVIYASQTIKDKQVFRATLGTLWFFIYLFMSVAQSINHHYTMQEYIIVLCSIPVMALAFLLGSKLVKNICQDMFQRVIYILLSIMSVIMMISSCIQ